jgi:hypothetical protein
LHLCSTIQIKKSNLQTFTRCSRATSCARCWNPKKLKTQ